MTNASETHKKKDRSLLILFSVIVLDLIGFGVVVPILPFYVQQFGSTASTLGIMVACYSAMQFVFSPIWGELSDKYGRKNILVFTIAGTCVGLTLTGKATSLAMLFAGRILSGIFAANISVASAYVTDVTDEENRAKGMGMIGAAFGIGFLLGPAMGGALSQYGYSIPILAAACLSAVNLIYTALRLKEPARHHHVENKIKTSLLSHRPILTMCLINLIFTLGVSQLESVFAFFMSDRFHYDAMHVAYILAMMALIMAGVQGGLIKALSQRFGERMLLLMGSLMLVAAFFIIPQSPTVAILLAPLAIASGGRAISQPSLMSLTSKKAGHHPQGAVMGIFQASASLGRVFGPFIAGFLYDYWHAAPFYLAAALLGLVFLMTINT